MSLDDHTTTVATRTRSDGLVELDWGEVASCGKLGPLNRRTFLFTGAQLCVWGCRAPKPRQPRDGGDLLRVVVVRHAEKALEQGVDDPPLTSAGAARAAGLVAAIDPSQLVAIYSTATRRTRATVAPLAKSTGLEIGTYEPTDFAGLLGTIRAQGTGTVVVVGHSNTIPDMLAAFGVEEPITIADDQYGDLFEVELRTDGARLRRGRFESPNDAATPEAIAAPAD